MSTMIGARIEEEVLESLEYVAQEERLDKSAVIRGLLAQAVQQKMIELALEKYAKRAISLGKAAELARVPLADFMKIAAGQKIALPYSLESLQKDFKAAQ